MLLKEWGNVNENEGNRLLLLPFEFGKRFPYDVWGLSVEEDLGARVVAVWDLGSGEGLDDGEHKIWLCGRLLIILDFLIANYLF